MSQPVVFRPRGGMILAIIAIGICVATLIFMLIGEGAGSFARWAWPIVLIAWGAWLLYIAPFVVMTEGFIEIHNIFATHRVPWGDVDSIDSRYALTVKTESGRTIRAWAAPAPGAREALSTKREEVSRTPGEGDTRRPSDSENSLSGGAAAIARRSLEAYRRAGGATLPGGTATTWSVLKIAVTALLAAAAVLSIALPQG